MEQRLWDWRLGLIAMALAAFAAGAALVNAEDDADDDGHWSAVFTITNDPEGNNLAVFLPDGSGGLSNPFFYPTGGLGANGGLGSEGAVALGHNGQYLYAVNAGSDSITVFHLGKNGPRSVQVIGSGGSNPVSLTVKQDLLYVVNAGGSIDGGVDSIAGFTIRHNGTLNPLDGSDANLSVANAGPGEVSFNGSGSVLAVTEKNTNSISLFPIDGDGLPGARVTVPSSGQEPFGFAFTRDDLMVVSEAVGGAAGGSTVSSYHLDEFSGVLDVISGSVKTKQSAVCWIAITEDSRFAYAANTGSGTITGFKIAGKGALQLLNNSGVTATTGNAPGDMAILGNSVLFVLNVADGSVGAYAIQQDGSLTFLSVSAGLPATHPAGLVVR